MTKNNTLSYRVTELEKRVEHLVGKLDLIRTNDLPHLREEMTSLKTRVNVAAVINVGAIIVGALILKYL